MPSQVVDASVVLKWQLEDEEAVAQALALRDDYLLRRRIDLVAPSLLVYELTNGMLTAVRQRRLLQDRAQEGLANLLAAGIQMVPADPYRIFSLSVQWRLSAYDGAYLAIAERLNCEVWTGDKAFYNACRKRGSRVHWIGDYP